MRQGQQNRRGRGRNNNNQNRKGQNPLTRSFESTGPDVKIRGTPAHIAEKYMTLARDAQSSGDPVLAENYLQHAEHYNRIIMAFREQQIAQGGGDMQNGMGRPRPGFGDPMSMSDDFSDDDGDEMGGEPHHSMPQQQPQYSRGHDMQPRPNEGQRFDDRGPRQGHDQHRQPHHRDRDRDRDRQGGEQRGFSERHERQDRPQRFQRPERMPQQQPDPGLEGGSQHQRRNDSVVAHHEQPEFLRRPVRRPRREGNGMPSEEPGAVPTSAVEDTGHD
jgi:hypothetical protein